MENQEKLTVIVEGPEKGRVALLAGILQLLRGVGISAALESRSRKAIVDASADSAGVNDAMARLGDRYLIELRGQQVGSAEAVAQLQRELEDQIKKFDLRTKEQRVTIPVGSSPDGVASGDPEEE